MYAQLLIDLFKFLAPFLRNADLNRAMQVLYKVRALVLDFRVYVGYAVGFYMWAIEHVALLSSL